MNFVFISLLHKQREIYDLPRGSERFDAYLRLLNRANPADIVAPLLIVNPMAREPFAAALDTLLVLDADGVAARAVAETAETLAGVPGGSFRVSLVLADDAGGGWTNRYAWEFSNRFERPPAAHGNWRTGVLWSGEQPSAHAAREAVLLAVYREAYFQRHGPARTLGERLTQEGAVLQAADCTLPTFGEDELAYTREIIRPHLEATDLPTTTVHLFGDPAARSLGYRPAGLSPWAGLALALHDARACRPSIPIPTL